METGFKKVRQRRLLDVLRALVVGLERPVHVEEPRIHHGSIAIPMPQLLQHLFSRRDECFDPSFLRLVADLLVILEWKSDFWLVSVSSATRRHLIEELPVFVDRKIGVPHIQHAIQSCRMGEPEAC